MTTYFPVLNATLLKKQALYMKVFIGKKLGNKKNDKAIYTNRATRE